MHVRRLLAAALCASALTACSDDPEPVIAAPSPTPTVANTPSQTPTREAWEEKTDRGAQAFSRHWIEAFNAMRSTGDTTQLRDISTDNCQTCANVVELTESIYGAGGSIKTQGWTVNFSSQPAEPDSAKPVIALGVTQAAQQVQYESEGKAKHFDGGKVRLTAYLVWQHGWKMDRLDLSS